MFLFFFFFFFFCVFCRVEENSAWPIRCNRNHIDAVEFRRLTRFYCPLCPRCHLAPCEVEGGSLAPDEYVDKHNKLHREILKRNREKELEERTAF